MKPAANATVIDFPRSGRPPGLRRRERSARIVAVGGGKGGVGKTMLSANLGIALANKGNRVLLVDADLGGANLHTSLGIAPPALSLSDFVNRRVERLRDVAVPSGIEGLSVVAGAQDLFDAANPKYQQKVKLLRHLRAMDVDYVVLDLGAGTSFNVLDFFLIADHGVVVLLPEPTSIENAYRFLRSALFRRLQTLGDENGLGDLVTSALASRETRVRTPFDLLERARGQTPELADKMEHALQAFQARIVVNQARSDADRDVGNAVVAAWKKFFGLDMAYLGAISYDDEAWRAVRKRRPILLETPHSDAGTALLRVAENLLALDGRV